MGTFDAGILLAWLQEGFYISTGRYTETVNAGIRDLDVAVDIKEAVVNSGQIHNLGEVTDFVQ